MISINFKDFTYKGVQIDSLTVTSEAKTVNEFDEKALEDYLNWYVKLMSQPTI